MKKKPAVVKKSFNITNGKHEIAEHEKRDCAFPFGPCVCELKDQREIVEDR